MSEEEIRDVVDDASEPAAGDDRDCPIVALGQRNGQFYFIGTSGEIRVFEPRHFTNMGIVSLFGGGTQWLWKNFPKRARESEEIVGFSLSAAGAFLMRRAAAAGLWNEETPIRGPGVWRDDKKQPLAHCGDMLFVQQGERPKWIAAGVYLGSAIYPAAPAITRPCEIVAAGDDARKLLDCIGLWKWKEPHAPRMALGWIGLAMLGAAPLWRVHFLVSGARGGGKSRLVGLLQRALGGWAYMTNNFSEAGLRSALTNQARALLLDEAENTLGDNRVGKVIELLRLMSGGEGARGVRGTAEGGARSFQVAAPAFLAAINAPQLEPQDRSRIFEAEIAKPDGKNVAKLEEADAFAEKASPGLRARALAGWQRFLDNFEVYRAELLRSRPVKDKSDQEAPLCDVRQADQWASLLAAADMMLHDTAIDSDSAEAAVESLAEVLKSYVEEDVEEDDARQCLATLMTTQIEHWRGGAKSTIGRLVELGLEDGGRDERDALRVYGLRLDFTSTDAPRLAVANRHEGLSAIFRNTRWRDGGWKRALLRLDKAVAADKPVRFHGFLSRAIVIPAEHLPQLAKKPAPPPEPMPNDF